MELTQVVVIHGSDCYETFEAYVVSLKEKVISADRLRPRADWKAGLVEQLGDGFDVLTPRMPLSGFAPYTLWELWFTRCAEVFEKRVTLVGHSLGGILLAKYLALHDTVPFHVDAVHLVAAPFRDDPLCPMPHEWSLPDNLSLLQALAPRTHIYHSTDDPVVPYTHAEAYVAALPEATLHTFRDRGHFLQGEFPELVAALTEPNAASASE